MFPSSVVKIFSEPYHLSPKAKRILPCSALHYFNNSKQILGTTTLLTLLGLFTYIQSSAIIYPINRKDN